MWFVDMSIVVAYMEIYMLGITITTVIYKIHEKRSRLHGAFVWDVEQIIACFLCVLPSGLTNVCVSYKLLTQWLDWCNDSSDVKHSSDDYSVTKTINVCIRFIKCNPCTEGLHLVLHSVLRFAEVLGKLVLIERYWTVIYFSNKSFNPPSGSFRHHSNLENKQKSHSNFVSDRAKPS